MNESQYINLQKRQWRAITTNWEILSQNSLTESRLYCLTDFQVSWLLSVTEYFRWMSRWENCPCTQSELESMRGELDYNLMNCLGFSPYQLQTLYDASQNALIDGYESLWDGSLPSSVNPSAPDDFFDGNGSTDREDALCTAMTLWCYSYAVDWQQRAGQILGLTTSFAALIAFMIPAGGNIAILVFADLIAPLAAQLYAMQNQTALDIVICDWRTALEGVAINATNWIAAVAGLSYTVGTDQYMIQQLFATDSQLLGNFLSFVNALGDGYDLAQLGIEICACGTGWIWDSDFDNDMNIFEPSDNGYGDLAIWIDGFGWFHQDGQIGSSTYARIVQITTPVFTATYVESIRMSYDLLKGTYSSGGVRAVSIIAVKSDDTLVRIDVLASAAVNGNDQTLTLNVNLPNIKQIRMFVASSTQSTAVFSGTAKINELHIVGDGFNPFA